jgi:tetratricopeptide (TPR) repeat protein
MITALVVASLWLDASAMATTDPAPATNPSASEVSEPDGAGRAPASADAAAVLVKEAEEQYKQGLFDDALAKLEQATRLSPDPSIVYDIAQIKRKRGDCAAALAGYNRYLETTAPTDAQRRAATRWATEMKACVDKNATSHVVPPPSAGGAAPTGPAPIPKATGVPTVTASTLGAAEPPVVPPLTGVEATASPLASATHRRARIAGWSMVAAGGLCEIAAIVLQVKAWDIQKKLDSEPNTDPNRQDQLNSGNSYAHWALGTAIAGAALAAGGTWLVVVNRQTDPVAPPTTVLAVAGTF